MPTFNRIRGEESSTTTFKATTITQTRNSSVMHQEVVSIGDTESSLGIAAVLATTPASTAWGVVVREAAPSTLVTVRLQDGSANVLDSSTSAMSSGARGLLTRFVAPGSTLHRYFFANGAMPTTSASVAVATSTSIKTLLQITTVAGQSAKVSEWGISFDGSLAATPVTCELIETSTVFATVTAANSSDISLLSNPSSPNSTSFFTVGTAATGYNASAEGSITSMRRFDLQFVAPTNQYVKQFPFGREPAITAQNALRIRVKTTSSNINAFCYVIMDI